MSASDAWELWAIDLFDREATPSREASGTGMLEGLTELWRRALEESYLDDGRPTFTAFTLTCGRLRYDVPRDPTRNPELGALRRWRFEPDLLEEVARAHLYLADRGGPAALVAAIREAASPDAVRARLAAFAAPRCDCRGCRATAVIGELCAPCADSPHHQHCPKCGSALSSARCDACRS